MLTRYQTCETEQKGPHSRVPRWGRRIIIKQALCIIIIILIIIIIIIIIIQSTPYNQDSYYIICSWEVLSHCAEGEFAPMFQAVRCLHKSSSAHFTCGFLHRRVRCCCCLIDRKNNTGMERSSVIVAGDNPAAPPGMEPAVGPQVAPPSLLVEQTGKG